LDCNISNNMNDNNDHNINNNYEINDNIIEFNKKNKIVNFLDEKTNKRYKLYTRSNVKVKKNKL